ncbi:hypothetical protein BGX34_000376 [Mortierella sp. NVP85]|nr:hypothetical protein BGX34_000376 [Mortierella sp. NVP85]
MLMRRMQGTKVAGQVKNKPDTPQNRLKKAHAIATRTGEGDQPGSSLGGSITKAYSYNAVDVRNKHRTNQPLQQYSSRSTDVQDTQMELDKQPEPQWKDDGDVHDPRSLALVTGGESSRGTRKTMRSNEPQAPKKTKTLKENRIGQQTIGLPSSIREPMKWLMDKAEEPEEPRFKTLLLEHMAAKSVRDSEERVQCMKLGLMIAKSVLLDTKLEILKYGNSKYGSGSKSIKRHRPVRNERDEECDGEGDGDGKGTKKEGGDEEGGAPLSKKPRQIPRR